MMTFWMVLADLGMILGGFCLGFWEVASKKIAGWGAFGRFG